MILNEKERENKQKMKKISKILWSLKCRGGNRSFYIKKIVTSIEVIDTPSQI